MKRRNFIKFNLIFALNLMLCDSLKGENLNDKENLLKLYKDFYKFKLNTDTDGLSQILDENFTLTHMTGYKQSKSEWLSQVKNGQMKYFSAKEDSVEIHLNGKKAVITSKNRVGAQIHSLMGEWNLRLVMNAINLGDKWIIENIIASSY